MMMMGKTRVFFTLMGLLASGCDDDSKTGTGATGDSGAPMGSISSSTTSAVITESSTAWASTATGATSETGQSTDDSTSGMMTGGDTESAASEGATEAESGPTDSSDSEGDETTPNTGPNARDIEFEAISGVPVEVPFMSSDPDGDALSHIIYTEPSFGTLEEAEDGSFVYTSLPDWQGVDAFAYRAYDGKAKSNIAAGTIDVRLPE